MPVALTSSEKALVLVLFLVLLPTVPLAIALTRATRRAGTGPATGEVRSGRGASPPFRVIGIVGGGIAVARLSSSEIGDVAKFVAVADASGNAENPSDNGPDDTPP